MNFREFHEINGLRGQTNEIEIWCPTCQYNCFKISKIWKEKYEKGQCRSQWSIKIFRKWQLKF